jgi:hypothetical protein
MKNLFKAIPLLTLLVGLNQPLSAKKHESSCSSSSEPTQQGSWQPLTNQPDFVAFDESEGGAATPLLLTDGSILVLNQGPLAGSNEVWKLTPDIYGSYVNGTWSQLASFPDYLNEPFSPYASATAVLADGRVIFAGGENNGVTYEFIEASMVAIYDPVADSWTTIDPPTFCCANPLIFGLFDIPDFEPIPSSELHPAPYIGDSQCVVLEDGTFMLGCSWCDKSALLDLNTLTWKPTGANKLGTNHEEGWTLLPDGKVLVVDLYVADPNPPSPSHQVGSELYDPNTGKWSKAADLREPISNDIYVTGTTGSGGYPYPDHEVGSTCLRPDGTVIAFGGADTGKNAIYNTHTKKWSKGPSMPFIVGAGQLSCVDTAAALLPNGNVLVAASPYADDIGLNPPTYFFELTLNNNNLIPQPIPPRGAEEPAYFLLLTLPTGQVLAVDNSNDVEIYTPSNQNYKKEWAPQIEESPKEVSPGSTYKISGIRFNGMSQGAMYGDDYNNATNYPLVRITNEATGHVFYCRTHDHSFMGVASDRTVHTYFDVPANIESGSSKLEVVANGIPSKAKRIYVR